MKKFVLFVLILFIITCFCGCTTTKSTLEMLSPYISTYQTELYAGGNEDLTLSISSIVQEEIFVTDGEIGDLSLTTLFLLKPHCAVYLDYTYSYSIIGSEGQIDGNLEKTLLGISFSDDIENLELIGEIKNVTIFFNKDSINFELKNILKNAINYTIALEKAYEIFKENLDPLLQTECFDREIYIKLVTDKESSNSDYYWYVSFIKSNDNYMSALIDLEGDIITTRVKEPENSN